MLLDIGINIIALKITNNLFASTTLQTKKHPSQIEKGAI
jgi:hypothetical protein